MSIKHPKLNKHAQFKSTKAFVRLQSLSKKENSTLLSLNILNGVVGLKEERKDKLTTAIKCREVVPVIDQMINQYTIGTCMHGNRKRNQSE